MGQRSVYPSSNPKLVIDHNLRKCYVQLDIDDPKWTATISLVDELLGGTTNPAESRKRFADGLQKIEDEAKKAERG
jgi:hypothetical protein